MVTPISAYQRFYESLKSPTRKSYAIWLDQFLKHSKASREGLANLQVKEIEDLVINWVIHLKRRAEGGQIVPNAIGTRLYAIQHYCEQNDKILNWKKIRKYLPEKVQMKNQGAWMDDDILKMLDATSSKRNKALILFLASSGARVGANTSLRVGDIIPIEKIDPKEQLKGAMVWVYNDSNQSYRTFLTPEAYAKLIEYWEEREFNLGRKLAPDDFVFSGRDHEKKLNSESIRGILPDIQVKAGVRPKKAENKRTSKSPNHAFRKRFELCLKRSSLASKDIEILCGGVEVGRDKHYYRNTELDENLWKEYKKAIPMLTVNPNDRLKQDLERQMILNEEYENVLKKKLAEIEERYRKDLDFMAIQNVTNQAKIWAMSEINFKVGNNVLDKKHREFLKELSEIDDAVELQKIIEKYGFTISWNSKKGWKINELDWNPNLESDSRN